MPPKREDFLAARLAAHNCAVMSGWLLGIMSLGSDAPNPQVDALQDLVYPPPSGQLSGTDGDRDRVCKAVADLCRTLGAGQGKILPVEQSLILVAAAPVSAGGMTRATAHRLAWDHSLRLWLEIRDSLRLWFAFRGPGSASSLPGEGFRIGEEAVRENLGSIRGKLRARPLFDARRVIEAITIESAKAMAAGGHDAETDFIICSQRELAKALGRANTAKLIPHLERDGILERGPMAGRKYRIRFLDRRQHEEVRRLLLGLE